MQFYIFDNDSTRLYNTVTHDEITAAILTEVLNKKFIKNARQSLYISYLIEDDIPTWHQIIKNTNISRNISSVYFFDSKECHIKYLKEKYDVKKMVYSKTDGARKFYFYYDFENNKNKIYEANKYTYANVSKHITDKIAELYTFSKISIYNAVLDILKNNFKEYYNTNIGAAIIQKINSHAEKLKDYVPFDESNASSVNDIIRTIIGDAADFLFGILNENKCNFFAGTINIIDNCINVHSGGKLNVISGKYDKAYEIFQYYTKFMTDIIFYDENYAMRNDKAYKFACACSNNYDFANEHYDNGMYKLEKTKENIEKISKLKSFEQDAESCDCA
jgi:hypothetical protein